MSIETAFAFALDLVDGDTCRGRATAYVTGNLLYVGPRKRAAEPGVQK
jgi:hypothetical protein